MECNTGLKWVKLICKHMSAQCKISDNIYRIWEYTLINQKNAMKLFPLKQRKQVSGNLVYRSFNSLCSLFLLGFRKNKQDSPFST